VAPHGGGGQSPGGLEAHPCYSRGDLAEGKPSLDAAPSRHVKSIGCRRISQKVKNVYWWEFKCKGLTVQVASSDSGAVRVGIGFIRKGDFVSELKALGPRADIFEDFGPNEALINVIEAYLRGDNPPIDLPWDINASTFTYKVWTAVCTIPYGETRYYKDVACMVGRPRGARAAGQALNRNPLPILIPCHRVVSIDGLGGFGAGIDVKRYLLNLEQGKFASRTEKNEGFHGR